MQDVAQRLVDISPSISLRYCSARGRERILDAGRLQRSGEPHDQSYDFCLSRPPPLSLEMFGNRSKVLDAGRLGEVWNLFLKRPNRLFGMIYEEIAEH